MNQKPRICVVGSSMFDQVTRAPRLPGPGETFPGTSFHTGFGGKGANQAVMAARLGAHVTLVAKLGRDAIGEQTARHYADENILTEFLYYEDHRSSGVASIWVDELTGQNRILMVPGANQSLTPAEVRNARGSIHSAQAVLCQLETPVECSLEAFRIAREVAGVTTLLNPAPSVPIPEELLRQTDVLAPNESEAAALAGLPVSTPEEAELAARELQRRGARTVLITLGAAGALALTPAGEIIRVASPRVRAVDTTGAGDCFIGSLACFLALNFPLRTAMERACLLASQSVQSPGAQSSFPHRSSLDPALFTLGHRNCDCLRSGTETPGAEQDCPSRITSNDRQNRALPAGGF